MRKTKPSSLVSLPIIRKKSQFLRMRQPGKMNQTHEMKNELNSCAGGAGRPSASVAGRNSKVASMFAIANHTMSCAKKRPGQIRRPNPNARSGSGGDVTGSRKRSGLNFSGSGYVSGSCRIALNYQTRVVSIKRGKENI